MVRSERMQTVAGLAKDHEDRAAQALAELRRQYEGSELRLEELQKFQGEYQQRMETLGREGMSIQQLNQHRRFNERLGGAVAQQRRVVEEMKRRIEQQMRSWSEASAKRHALDETVSRL
ncbi:MAG: flagellar export protein FliJ, partial [Chromatiales bacterium]|nr:flagellar export protein FliJ [Chromatiales bacterium]